MQSSLIDNRGRRFSEALRNALPDAERAELCVGYFNLRGWSAVADRVEAMPLGEQERVRLLVGMQRAPRDLVRDAARAGEADPPIDLATANRLRREVLLDFRRQLQIGTPSATDERALRRLADQIRDGKVKVKLFLRHPLHAKLYLFHRDDRHVPISALLGSSNLTFSGLSGQGELNVELVERGLCAELAAWFEDHWFDRFCVDIGDELVQIIGESWAGLPGPTPFEVYLKIARELSREAQAGVGEYVIPPDIRDTLFPFQQAAVQMAAGKLDRQNGVLIGDVVGLGKTLMAVALVRTMEERRATETLVLCPKNLVPMWEHHVHKHALRGARVMSTSEFTAERLKTLPAYRLVVIDESHNLRNREAKTYARVREYLGRSRSRVILLSATPYNKSYSDLGSQLRLFVGDDDDLGLRPERLIGEIGLVEFKKRHDAGERTLAAFEKSDHPDDWRDLMRLYLVRRTRSFIKETYGKPDDDGRVYLELTNGGRSYFPKRVPKTVKIRHKDDDAYAKLYSDASVAVIDRLELPRYGLAGYLSDDFAAGPAEQDVVDNLSRAGRRLKGFCRTNLFKRLESSGHAFYQSVRRHVLRNHVTLHALEGGLPVPIGTQDVAVLDPDTSDDDALFEPDDPAATPSESDYRRLAGVTYRSYRDRHASAFAWLPAEAFQEQLAIDLLADARALDGLLTGAGPWNAEDDRKLARLERLLRRDHKGDKVVVFTQFADTVRYLERELKRRGLGAVKGVTGDTADVVDAVRRFSPTTNDAHDLVGTDRELRVLIATDVLSEGQNLQGAATLVNYDLPWAIIRLIQRAGRVDRIGQQAHETIVHSFMPADGIEQVIRLRGRVDDRLRQNAEVLGSDEVFFAESDRQRLVDLYNEKSGSLDDAGASHAGVTRSAGGARPSHASRTRSWELGCQSFTPHACRIARRIRRRSTLLPSAKPRQRRVARR